MKVFAFLLAAFAVLAVQGQEGICPPGEDFWPHQDCTKYYICDNGTPIELDCPEPLYWHHEETQCDFPMQVPECIDGTRPPVGSTTVGPTTTNAPETSTAAPSSEATSSAPSSAEPTSTQPTSEATQATSTAPPTNNPSTAETPETEATGTSGTSTHLPPGTCPSEGIHKIAHEEFCNFYWLCVNGVRIEPYSECPPGLYFDPELEECNVDTEVDCQNSNSTTSTSAPPSSTLFPGPNCPPTGVHYLPYPGNCELYYICIESDFSIYRCPNGTLFDSVTLLCIDESIAVCIEKQEQFENTFSKMFMNLFRI